MDMVNKDDAELETRNEDALNFQSINMSSDWQLSGSNLTNASMVNSFCASVWNHPTGSSNLGFYNTNIQLNPGTTDALGTVNRMLGTGWTQPNEMLKGATFVPSAANMLPQSLAQFPADSGLIERAARFSCFSVGKVGDTVDSFIIPKSPNTYYNGLQPPSAVSNQKQQMGNAVGNSMDVTLPLEHGVTDRSPFKNEKNEAKECVGISGNESDEAECSDHQEELEGRDSSPRSLGSKKRKRSGQQEELNQMKRAQRPPAEPMKDRAEIQKGVQNLNSTASKPGGKNGKRESKSTEPPKEEYIHIRARRGQATNSHSLAERLRREKISERMKFLQDLVPGCNKVTGKAVMLDEIINYVQSLQRQVEFLSMKLATVNPQLDFNLDGFIAKDILHSRAGPSSSFAFAPDMTMAYPSVHQLQPGLLQSGLPSLGNSTDAFLRSLHPNFAATSGGYKDSSSSQLLNIWDDELHNVVDMGVSTSAPLLNQDLSGGMKAEP